MYVLLLNDMRRAHVEDVEPVARAEIPEALLAFMEREKVEPYRDGRWGKSFRRGGPLEWFNPMVGFGRIADAGTLEDWIGRARREWEAEVMALPEVGL